MQRETSERPRNALEELLFEVWRGVLPDRAIGVADDFYELGGTAEEAADLRARVRAVFGQELPLPVAGDGATLERMAKRLEGGVGKPGAGAVVRLQEGSGGVPVFCICAIGGTVFHQRHLARELGPERPFFGLQAVDLEPELGREARIEDFARHYADCVEACVPAGPFALGGHSFGAVVAYELARILRERGREPALLFLMDTAPPNQGRPTMTERAEALFTYLRGLPYLPVELLDRARRDPARLRSELRKALRWKLEAARRQLLNLVDPGGDGPRGTRMSDPDLTPDDFLDMSHWPEHHRVIARRHYRAMQAYRTPTYAGAVTLFRVNRHPSSFRRGETYGWKKYVQGGLEVVRVPGGHQSLIHPPNVRTLARHVVARLERIPPVALP